MSGSAISLHFGHLVGTDAAFFMATLVYMPVGAVALVAAMEAGARSGLRLAQGFVARYERLEPPAKAAAFLMIVSSSVDLGYIPGHLLAEPVAAALFGLDAAALVGSSLLVVVRPELRPAVVILLVAGMLAYAIGGVQLDVTVIAAKAVELLALVLLVTAIVRAGASLDEEVPAPAEAVAAETVARSGRGGRRGRRARGGRKAARPRGSRSSAVR